MYLERKEVDSYLSEKRKKASEKQFAFFSFFLSTVWRTNGEMKNLLRSNQTEYFWNTELHILLYC